MESAAVAESDVFWEPGRDPVDAGHHRLHDLDAAEMLKGLSCIGSCEDEDPEIDVDGRGGSAGYPHDLYFSGEICQEFFCEILIDTDTHHALSVPDSGRKRKPGQMVRAL